MVGVATRHRPASTGQTVCTRGRRSRMPSADIARANTALKRGRMGVKHCASLSKVTECSAPLASIKPARCVAVRPPTVCAFSNTVTCVPARCKPAAQAAPARPEPITATWIKLGFRVMVAPLKSIPCARLAKVGATTETRGRSRRAKAAAARLTRCGLPMRNEAMCATRE